jgi:Concanavalin A-like lectin/glucanases superfamily
MATPTDGYGVYEGIVPTTPANYQPRLLAIKAAGFSVVVNYSLLFGHISDIIGYINYAASIGLKVAVTVHDVRIWRDNTYATNYPQLYADSGNAATGTLFMQYIVAQTKNLAGTYGWYAGDEINNSDHTTYAPYAAAVKTADSTHPRLFVQDGSQAYAVTTGTSLFYDSCDILGDDIYPIGYAHYPYSVAQSAQKIQTFDNAHSISSLIVLQAFSQANYGITGAPWPTEAQMIQARHDALTNMAPRLILFYSYYDAVSAGAPAMQWSFVTSAMAGRSGIDMFPPTRRRGATSQYAPTVLGDLSAGSAYYRLQDSYGVTVADSSGNGYNGTTNNDGLGNPLGIQQGQASLMTAKGSRSTLFDGTVGYITLPSSLNPSGWTAITVELWLKLTSITAGFEFVIANSTNPVSNHNGFQLIVPPSGHSNAGTFEIGTGSSGYSLSFGTANFTAATNHHLVMTYDGAIMRVYVDGAAATSTTAATGAIAAASSPILLGKDPASANYAPMYMSEVAIYKNVALSQVQVTNHYNAGVSSLRDIAMFPPATRRQS